MVIGTMCNLICDTVIIFCNLRSWFFILRRDLKMELGMMRIIIVPHILGQDLKTLCGNDEGCCCWQKCVEEENQ